MAPPRARSRRAKSAAAESDAGGSGGPARLGGPPGRGEPSLPEPPRRGDSSLPEPRLGQKVSILYRLHGGEHPFSEIVGIVQRIAEDPSRGPLIAVLRRNGMLVEVPRADVVRMKIVPTDRGGPIRLPKVPTSAPESQRSADP
ncbi:MAG TPA: hypothetical protein VII47_00650 [Actinomycetota bacterium]